MSPASVVMVRLHCPTPRLRKTETDTDTDKLAQNQQESVLVSVSVLYKTSPHNPRQPFLSVSVSSSVNTR